MIFAQTAATADLSIAVVGLVGAVIGALAGYVGSRYAANLAIQNDERNERRRLYSRFMAVLSELDIERTRTTTENLQRKIDLNMEQQSLFFEISMQGSDLARAVALKLHETSMKQEDVGGLMYFLSQVARRDLAVRGRDRLRATRNLNAASLMPEYRQFRKHTSVVGVIDWKWPFFTRNPR